MWVGVLELELNSASDYDNGSEEDDSSTASDGAAWRDHTDAISIVREKFRVEPNPCPPDVLPLRNTSARWRWNEAKLYCDFAALWFL